MRRSRWCEALVLLASTATTVFVLFWPDACGALGYSRQEAFALMRQWRWVPAIAASLCMVLALRTKRAYLRIYTAIVVGVVLMILFVGTPHMMD